MAPALEPSSGPPSYRGSELGAIPLGGCVLLIASTLEPSLGPPS